MKISAAKGVFNDPQNLASSPTVTAALVVQLRKTSLQVDQRLAQLKSVFLEAHLFPKPLSSLAGGLASSKKGLSEVKNSIQVLDHSFGAGLDFLLTWKLWLQAYESDAQIAPLRYLAICAQPLCLKELKQLHQHWPQLSDLSLQLQDQYPANMKGFYELVFGRVKLTIVQAESEHALEQVQGKFEVCLGELESQAQRLPNRAHASLKRPAYVAPWRRPSPGVARKANKVRVAVIGAGISGVATAYSLSQRGFSVTLIDQGSELASGASGNRQAMLYAKLPDNATIAGQFHQQGLQHTMALLKRTLAVKHWQACGLLQLATTRQQLAQMQAVLKRQYPAAWLQWLDQPDAERLAQQALSAGGLYFPNSGWVSPLDWCAALYAQSGADLWLNTRVQSLQQSASQVWQLDLKGDHAGQHLFDAVVVANATDAKGLLTNQYLPLKSIRGQISYITPHKKHHASLSPALVVCGEGYVTPAQQGCFAVGASYNLGVSDAALSAQDHRSNLARLAEVLPLNKTLGLESIVGGRVGFRAVTPDYLPMVGQLADETQMLDRFAKLRQDANYKFTQTMPYLTGLYLNVGHGSKGLITAPLSAEILACQMADESLPVAQCVAWGLDPNRFIIRDLIRRKR